MHGLQIPVAQADLIHIRECHDGVGWPTRIVKCGNRITCGKRLKTEMEDPKQFNAMGVGKPGLAYFRDFRNFRSGHVQGFQIFDGISLGHSSLVQGLGVQRHQTLACHRRKKDCAEL